MDDTSSDNTMPFDSVLQTSQQKSSGHQRAEGNAPSSGPTTPYGDENAPTGISTAVAMSNENQLKTTQQIKGEYSLPEGPKVVTDSAMDAQQ